MAKAAAKHKMHVKKGDLVMVITGKDAGKKGKVLEVLTKKGRVIVVKVNMAKRHTRPSKSLPQGGFIEKEAPIDSSNVMLYCSECKSVTRKAVKETEKGKIRVCKKCGANLPE